MTTKKIMLAAAKLFNRREACAAQLREIDAELAMMHGDYMRAERLWGLRLEGFRHTIQVMQDSE
jgi:hypothetical protein